MSSWWPLDQLTAGWLIAYAIIGLLVAVMIGFFLTVPVNEADLGPTAGSAVLGLQLITAVSLGVVWPILVGLAMLIAVAWLAGKPVYHRRQRARVRRRR